MAQVIIKKRSVNKGSESVADEVIVTGDQVFVSSEKSVTVTFTESDIVVDLA